MLIETTLYAHKNTLNRLDIGITSTGKSRNYLIKLLMQRIMKDNHKMIKTYSRIKYQNRDLKENWKRINVVLNEYEYEYYLDLRKFFKMSISLILAYVVFSYLDDLLKKNRNTDNYFYRNYIFIKKTFEEVICWHIYWGIPPDTHILLKN